jgi:hypothetical protein
MPTNWAGPMWRKLRLWFRAIRLPFRGGGIRGRARLMGLYLDQTNQPGPAREVGDPTQERQDGKYAQRRERD